MTFNFLYADIEASGRLLEKYVLNDWVHALNPVTASTLRGGLLSNCNVRFLYITNIGKDFRIEDEDYKQQGLYIFPSHLYYQVLDKWHIGNQAQILLTPHRYPSDIVIDSIVRAARDDFRELHDTEPVTVLDTAEWKARIAMQPGFNGKNAPHKQGR